MPTQNLYSRCLDTPQYILGCILVSSPTKALSFKQHQHKTLHYSSLSMALHQFPTSSQTSRFIERVSCNFNPSFIPRIVKVISKTTATRMCSQTIVRRSGNYQPPFWKHEFIQSLRSEFGVWMIKSLNWLITYLFNEFNFEND